MTFSIFLLANFIMLNSGFQETALMIPNSMPATFALSQNKTKLVEGVVARGPGDTKLVEGGSKHGAAGIDDHCASLFNACQGGIATESCFAQITARFQANEFTQATKNSCDGCEVAISVGNVCDDCEAAIFYDIRDACPDQVHAAEDRFKEHQAFLQMTQREEEANRITPSPTLAPHRIEAAYRHGVELLQDDEVCCYASNGYYWSCTEGCNGEKTTLAACEAAYTGNQTRLECKPCSGVPCPSPVASVDASLLQHTLQTSGCTPNWDDATYNEATWPCTPMRHYYSQGDAGTSSLAACKDQCTSQFGANCFGVEYYTSRECRMFTCQIERHSYVGAWTVSFNSCYGQTVASDGIIGPAQQRALKKWIEKAVFAMEQKSCTRKRWGKRAATGTWDCSCCSDCTCIWPLCHYGCNGHSDDGTSCWENCVHGIHTDQCIGTNSYCGRAGFRECHTIVLDQVISIVSMIANFIPGGKVLGAMSKSFKAIKKAGGGFAAASKAAMKTYIRKQGTVLRNKAKKNLKKYVKNELKPRVKATIQSQISEVYASEQIDEAIDAVLLKKAASETDMGQEIKDLAAAVDPTGIMDVVEAFNYPDCESLWPSLDM